LARVRFSQNKQPTKSGERFNGDGTEMPELFGEKGNDPRSQRPQ